MLLSSFSADFIEAGCDEAGRGCLAGPVFAAAVILPKDYKNSVLNDSKQLTEKKRDILRVVIEKEAIDYNVRLVSAARIDEINILNASFEAMNIAISELKVKPELLLIDGNRFYSDSEIPFKCIVKGDGKYLSIAAASVLAKTYRDEFMQSIDKEFPFYCWCKNKGYPTLEHKKAISVFGLTSYHRKTFNSSIQGKFDF